MSVSSVQSEPGGDPGNSGRESAAARSRAATRGRRRDSAQERFAERGLHGVTTHDIAHRAGVAAGTFYLHFKDKGELFREIAQETVADLRRRIDEATESAPDLRSAVRARAEAMVAFAEERQEVMRILFSGDTDAAAVESDVLDDLAGSIAEGRRKRVAIGAMSPDLDPTVLSQALVGMWARVLAWWTKDPRRADREIVIDTLTRIQLGGTHPA